MAQIIDGRCDFDNVTADVIARHNMSMYGTGDYVLQIDECLGYELISNNEIHVKDGVFITQGRRGYIKKGTADVCIIENGAQAVNRNDIIVIEYAKDEVTMLETHATKVIKGVAAAEAVDPEIITGDIDAGDVLHQMPLYRVKIEGLNIVAVEQLFEIGSVAAETVDPMLATEEGFAADALAVKNQFDEQNKNMGGLRFGVDGDGNYGYYGADDSLIPFKSKEFATFDITFDDADQDLKGGDKTKTYDISSIFNGYKYITKDNFLVQANSYGTTYYSGASGTTTMYNSVPRVTEYDATTGKVTINCGKVGFQRTNSGIHISWARSVTVFVFK